MIWLFLLPFFVFAQSVLASPTIKIDSVPLPFEIGTSISIPFTVTNTDVGNSYHYKVVGVGVSLDNLPDIKCNEFYNNCPIFSVGTSETIKMNSIAKLYNTTGKIYIKIAQVDTHSTKDGEAFSFDNNSPSQSVGETTSTISIPVPTLEPSLNIDSISL
ncbi:MAG: hypothetical protein NTY75_01605, partial [Candidatus Shapirobacteria bacterium]|nr:hypothetical protein [Candidatus Shapirobacteria bacterium]